MDLHETDNVRPEDERPARRDGTCFYCRQPMGAKHDPECVIVDKTVVVRFTTDVVIKVPRSWDKSDIEFRYNESTRCVLNTFEDLGRYAANHDDYAQQSCGCHTSSVEFLRDATEDDHQSLPDLTKGETP